MAMKKCEGANWCVAEVPEGTHACPVHTKNPALNSWENAEAWGKRVRRQRAAQLAAVARKAKIAAREAKEDAIRKNRPPSAPR
jgi:hypothetical protein